MLCAYRNICIVYAQYKFFIHLLLLLLLLLFLLLLLLLLLSLRLGCEEFSRSNLRTKTISVFFSYLKVPHQVQTRVLRKSLNLWPSLAPSDGFNYYHDRDMGKVKITWNSRVTRLPQFALKVRICSAGRFCYKRLVFHLDPRGEWGTAFRLNSNG